MQCRVENDLSLKGDEFVAAMRQIATTVAVVTTNGPAGKHGATVSSFCSVSADPPSMLICLHDSSRIAECVKINKCFCINVLPQEMSAVADRFAGRQDDTLIDRFDDVDHTNDNGDNHPASPFIVGAVAFHCQLKTNHASGSHRVMIGRVEHIDGRIERPLTYLDGQYRPWLV